MKLSKNDDIKLNIDSLTSEGSGIGRYDGFAVFVRGVVPGDEITAHIIKCSKNYAIAIVKDIIKPSKYRIESDCPVSDKCGGCSFRNVSYDEELKYKRTRVNDALERIGKLDIEVEEIIGADCTQNYRNKAQYPVSICDGELFAGFYASFEHGRQFFRPVFVLQRYTLQFHIVFYGVQGKMRLFAWFIYPIRMVGRYDYRHVLARGLRIT